MNMLRFSPIFRLTVGLILLTVSLLLVGDLFGLTPDEKRADLKFRKVIAESLAVQVSAAISTNRFDDVTEMLQTLQERQADVHSVALRRSDGRLMAIAGEHTALWDPASGSRSTASQVQVPIHSGGARWGAVEVVFPPFDGFWASLLSGASILTVILFVALAGSAAYWLFLKRALNELDPSAVVPDRVRTALDALAEGLVILDSSGRIVLANASFVKTIGESSQRLVGKRLSSLDWRDDEHRSFEDEADLPWHDFIDGVEQPSSREIRLSTSTHEALTFAVNCSAISAPDGAVRGVVVTFDDLTELDKKNSDLERALERLELSKREITRQNRELQVLATRDALTGVLNRRSLFDGLKTLMAEAVSASEPLSVIMVDIDHFKSINDRFGHATGDKVIKLLANILTDAVRADDLVGRYGGEEFCVVLPGVDEAGAAGIAEQMRQVLQQGDSAKFSVVVRITASFGVVTCTDEDLTPTALVDLADKALYHAKETGRNRVSRWSQLADNDSSLRGAKDTDTSPPQGARVERSSAAEARWVKDNEILRERIAELESQLAKRITGEHGLVEEGTPNRILLVDRIEQAVKRSERSKSLIAVLSLEIDSIKLVRDTQGSAAAGKLAKTVLAKLRSAVRSVDTVAVPNIDDIAISVSSLGSGEFVVLLTDMADAEGTTWVVQRIFSAMREIAEVDGEEVLLDTRIGVSLYPNDAQEAEHLMSNAATASREARATQDRQVCLYFDTTMNERSRQKLALQTQLAHALERDEFHLEYQPSIDLQRGRVVGVEALLRWRHPEHGLVRPDIFVPVAEHAGLIDELGDWVFETAALQLKQWHEMGYPDLSMSINFSALQFRRPDLVQRVVSTVTDVGLTPSALVVEITETTLIQNLDSAVAVVEGLSRAGLRIALDDFGTGYSSLSYLKRFPIDIVKIDRSFLRDFPAQAHDTEIVSAIVAIAHNLGLKVVAEGVETDRQFTVLQSLQCDEIQGYLFSKPLSREDAGILLGDPSRIRRIVRRIGVDPASADSSAPPPFAGVLNSAALAGVSASRPQ